MLSASLTEIALVTARAEKIDVLTLVPMALAEKVPTATYATTELLAHAQNSSKEIHTTSGCIFLAHYDLLLSLNYVKLGQYVTRGH